MSYYKTQTNLTENSIVSRSITSFLEVHDPVDPYSMPMPWFSRLISEITVYCHVQKKISRITPYGINCLQYFNFMVRTLEIYSFFFLS